jgi:hypothetical protein
MIVVEISRLHSESPFKIAKGANRRRKLVRTPGYNSYHCDGAFMARTVEIHIRLLHEGTECSRPTQALELGNGLFKVLPTSNYDPEDEVWEFPRTQSCAQR